MGRFLFFSARELCAHRPRFALGAPNLSDFGTGELMMTKCLFLFWGLDSTSGVAPVVLSGPLPLPLPLLVDILLD